VTYRWWLPYVARQWWFYLYIHETRSRKFSKSGAKTKRRCQAAKFSHRAPSSSPTASAPPTSPPSSRSARPTSTSAPPSSARALPLLPVDRCRLPLGRCPFSRGPSPRRRPRSPRRPTTSSPSATTPLPYQDDVLLPAGRFPNRRPGTDADSSTTADSTAAASADSSAAPARHRHLISSPLGTHGGRGWGRRRSNDNSAWLFFLFFKMQLHVLKMWINRLWINAITWTVDK
jgi:hypothetical protein